MYLFTFFNQKIQFFPSKIKFHQEMFSFKIWKHQIYPKYWNVQKMYYSE